MLVQRWTSVAGGEPILTLVLPRPYIYVFGQVPKQKNVTESDQIVLVDAQYVVPFDMKGCICHLTKWQIHPFISKRKKSNHSICEMSILFII